MLSKIKMYIHSDDFEITRHITSILHGVLMDIVSVEYADFLHSGGLNPYSMYLSKENNEWCWTVCTVGKTSHNEIIQKLADSNFTKFTVKHKDNAVIYINKKEVATQSAESVVLKPFNNDISKVFKIHFITPTAFKSGGRYVNYPDLFLIFQSLMKKSQLVSDEISFSDVDVLNALAENSHIVSYNLKTSRFYLEGQKITGFTGYIAIYSNGASAMRNLIELLLTIGGYLGVGIKASLGMGAMELMSDNGGGTNER